jgi:hypothetical protein
VPTVTIGAAAAHYSDDFNRADAATLGASWTHRYRSAGSTEIGISSNSAVGKTVDVMHLSTYNSTMLADDHSVEVTLGSNVDDIWAIALPIRSAGSNTVYGLMRYRINSSSYFCRIYTHSSYSIGDEGANGTLRTDGATDPGAWTSGWVFGFKAIDNLYTLYKRVSGTTTNLATWTDSGSAHPTGSGQRTTGLGVYSTSSTTGPQVDAWAADDL